jgi:predicted Zn-dependent protease
MKKVLLQFLTLIFIFSFIFWGLNSINWMSLFRINKLTEKTEKKLGEICWDMFKDEHVEIKDSTALTCIDSLLNAICIPNNIDKKKIKVHLLQSEEVNAFALPGNHLVIYSNLIKESGSPEALCGVIGHELAHLEQSHVTKKLIKEIGLTTLITIAGGENTGAIKEVVKTLTSTAYDRSLEKEADVKSVDYLTASKINPIPFADFMAKTDTRKTSTELENWFSTHPDSKERAEYIKAYTKKKGVIKNSKVLSDESWEKLNHY